MLYSTLVNTMLDLADSYDRFVLPSSIIPEALEAEYLKVQGEDIKYVKIGSHSIVYNVGNARFYYGVITNHPSTSSLKVIGASN